MDKEEKPDFTDPKFFEKFMDDFIKEHPDLSHEQKKEAFILGQSFKKASQQIQNENTNWWRSKSKFFRLWVFVSVVWAIFILILANPFKDISYMNGVEFLQALLLFIAPTVIGAIKLIYDKYVK